MVSNDRSVNWSALAKLRQDYVANSDKLHYDYWRDAQLVDDYDKTLGTRIAWKWDRVLDELEQHNVVNHLSTPTLIDWGCGSGIASTTFLQRFGSTVERVILIDRSQTVLS